MFELIKKDIFRYYQLEGGYPHNKLTRREKIRIIIVSHGLHAIVIYRFASFVDMYWNKNMLWKLIVFPLRFLSLCLEQIAVFIYGTLIKRDASIGEGLYIGHIGGIVVGAAKIGNNFTFTHNCTIGLGKIGSTRGIPTIADNVWIATNVVLYGDISIGSGVSVGPGSVVSKDICDRCLVAGNPARIIARDHDNSELLFGLDNKNNESDSGESE